MLFTFLSERFQERVEKWDKIVLPEVGGALMFTSDSRPLRLQTDYLHSAQTDTRVRT